MLNSNSINSMLINTGMYIQRLFTLCNPRFEVLYTVDQFTFLAGVLTCWTIHCWTSRSTSCCCSFLQTPYVFLFESHNVKLSPRGANRCGSHFFKSFVLLNTHRGLSWVVSHSIVYTWFQDLAAPGLNLLRTDSPYTLDFIASTCQLTKVIRVTAVHSLYLHWAASQTGSYKQQ